MKSLIGFQCTFKNGGRILKKRYIFLTAIIVISSIGIFLWFQSQNVDEGYVYATRESDLWIIIELDSKEVEGKTEEEILLLLEEISSEPGGAFYDIPLANQIIGTDFEKGDKVKVYWSGTVLQTRPGKIKGTSLIRKIEE